MLVVANDLGNQANDKGQLVRKGNGAGKPARPAHAGGVAKTGKDPDGGALCGETTGKDGSIGRFAVRGKRFFLAGIGGMGMLPLAIFLREGGAVVEGWDDALMPWAATLLAEAGVHLRDPAREPPACDFLVYSSAIRPGHPVFAGAPPGGRECLRRGELLARLATGRRLMAVAGSHGKTTTTAMIAWLAKREGFPMDHLVGGLPEKGLAPAANRGAEWLVAEIDESDGTIEGFRPEVTVFVNFDWDHADRYPEPEALRAAWSRLADRTTGAVCHPAGSADEPAWPPGIRRIAFRTGGGDFRRWNAAAAAAGFSVASGRDVDGEVALAFPGVWRRQTVHLRGNGFAVLEDYAHHPAEVAALLEWLRRERFPEPLRVYFQPHRFSRTTRFADEFVAVLRELDSVSLHDVYGAGESGDPGALERIASGLRSAGVRVDDVRSLGDFPGFGAGESPTGTYAFVGAGDANEWAAVLAARAKSSSPVEALFRMAGKCLGEGCLERNAPLGRMTTMRIGGPAALLATPDGDPTLRWLLRTSDLLEVPVAVLGNGSNVLVSDEGFDGLVVRLAGAVWEEIRPLGTGDRLLVGAGVALPALARRAAAEGLRGFEFTEGIPGTVGGALRMNAGAMGRWMENVVEAVEGIDRRGRRVSLPAEALRFGYRSCPGLEKVCALRAVLRGAGKDDPGAIRRSMRDFAARRRSTQPGGASAGCLFRNPEGDSAGRLIEASGLKGFRIGGAVVSEKHANFVLPERSARAADVLELMETVRQTVEERFGVRLEPEVRLLGPGSQGAWE